MRRCFVIATVLVIAGLACGTAAAKPKPPKYEIAGLQVALYRYGEYKGPIDGIAGPMTKQAIRNFQRHAHLKPDGVVGKRTRAALGKFGRPLFGTRTLKKGMFGFDVSVLQFLLAKRGFAPPALNSSYGGVTQRLVRRFQQKRGLAVDGVVGAKTRAALIGKRTKPTTRHTSAASPTRHVVRPGETLTSIATNHGTTVQALARRNGIDPRNLLLIGTKLLVPTARASATSSSIRVSIARWSAHYGVDGRLARALAWQESGFQNDVVSSHGAEGVMQVIPATWDFVELFVIGQSVPKTADGNVRVGVAYLDHLLKEFNGDTRRALAAYYQGPAAVHRYGVSAATAHFVANVVALRSRV